MDFPVTLENSDTQLQSKRCNNKDTMFEFKAVKEEPAVAEMYTCSNFKESNNCVNNRLFTVKHEPDITAPLETANDIETCGITVKYEDDSAESNVQPDPLLIDELEANDNVTTAHSFAVTEELICVHPSVGTKKRFTCRLCEYKTGRNEDLRRHMRTHTGEKPFQCNICGYKTALNGSLKQHMKTHSTDKPFVCEICDYRTAHHGNLKEHMKIHSSEKPLECSLCDYRTAHRTHLKQHVKTHTGEKPFVCKICNYKAGRGGSLRQHMRTHSGEKPFECSICKYKSGRRTDLKRHMSIHTGEKPFVCKMCKYKSSRKENLKKHMETHVGDLHPILTVMCD